MSKREKTAPEGEELKVLRMLKNGYPINVFEGRITVGTTVSISPSTLDSLVKKNWVTFQKNVHRSTGGIVRVYVSTKRGREALELAPDLEIARPEPVKDDRFGVVVPARSK